MTLLTFEKFHDTLSESFPFYDFANNNRKISKICLENYLSYASDIWHTVEGHCLDDLINF